MRFDRFYCAASPCLPSRAAWFTGLHGFRNGIVANTGPARELRIEQTQHRRGDPLNGDILRTPEMLSRYLRLEGMDTVTVSNFADRHAANWFLYGWSEAHSVNLKGGRESAGEVSDVALRWLRSNACRNNWLLHVNFWDVHRCYRVDPAWAERFHGLPAPTWPDKETIASQQHMTARFTAHGQFPNDESPFPLMPGAIRCRADLEHAVTGYDAAIACVDHHVGRVLDELRGQGLYDDCAVIVTADHGEAFGERGVYTDHMSCDECVHRIPMIVRWPGVSAGASDALLSNLDLFPSLCDLLGMQTPEYLDGSSFAPLLLGGNHTPRDHLVWESANCMAQRGVRTDTHLLLETYDAAGYSANPVELYDMTADPHQQHNIAQNHPQLTTTLRDHLSAWKQRMAATDAHDPFAVIPRCSPGI